MERLTYRDLIRMQADRVRSGASDYDLTPRQGKLAAVALATASNLAPHVQYPPSDDDRDLTVQRLTDAFWDGNARAIADAISTSAGTDLGTAIERAVTILRGM